MARKKRDMSRVLAGAGSKAGESAMPGLLADVDTDVVNNVVDMPGSSEGIKNYNIPAADIANEGKAGQDSKEKLGSKRRFIMELDPKTCKRWKYYDRFPEWFTYDGCKDIIDSMEKRKKQEFPGVVRKLDNDPDGFLWEVVYAGRRHYAALYLSEKTGQVFPFIAEQRNMNDQEAAELMDLENSKRKGLSNFESCVSYRQQLGKVTGFEPLYSTLNELKSAILADVVFDKDEKPPTKASFSQMVAAGELNEIDELISLFEGRRIKIKWTLAYHLMQAWNRDQQSRQAILDCAKEKRAKAPQMAVDDLLKMLINAASAKTPNVKLPALYSKDFKDSSKKTLLRAKMNDKELMLKIPVTSLLDNKEEIITELLKQALGGAKCALLPSD